MRKSFIPKIFISMIIITFVISCNKEKEISCTDPIAVNYNPDATSIPGSDVAHCIYDSSCITLIQNVDLNNYLMDSYYIDTTFIYGDFLQINIEYAGGCEDHIFNLVHEFIFCGTPPVYVPLYLTHNSNNDLCDAALSQELCFDISELYNLCADSSDVTFSLNDPENNTFIYF
tara:strand:+ start:811 stop:1329 length:519 start_codon:yes stop_codon:yes gene_type:complete